MTIAKTILITGASSGIGRATAAHLASKGCRVFGTSRTPAVETMDGFELLPLDVTADHSVQTCLNAVLERAGNLDVLINNAGVDLMGPIEETSLEEANWIFDTNFFGAVRMTKAVLPHMRARRSGQIINISSALGLAAWPFEAFYCASKHALEGYTESLRYEMSIFNIKVSSVQPGFYQTSIAQRQRLALASIRDYDGPRERAIQWFKKWVEEGSAPLPVARTVQRIIESRSPRLRYAVGLEAVLAPKLAHILPERILLWAGRRMLGM